jgi:ketosteroid isomerase-like protein
MRSFLAEWTAAWDDWELEVDVLHDAGEQVVAVIHQRGRSKVTGIPVDMFLAQVWTVRDGRETRMEMHSDPADAPPAGGLSE